MGDVLSALQHLNAAELSYSDWISVGMALKHEGYDCAVWEEWSRRDSRWHKGECERKWKSFLGSSSPVTGATIAMMARERGWEANTPMEWDGTLFYDGRDGSTGGSAAEELSLSPAEELILYLCTLFRNDEHVSYVAQSYQDEDGRWKPGSQGCCDRTAGELIAELERHPDDIGAVIGDTKPDAGAWIRFNPVDGKGARNDNVTAFRHALVESDSMSISEQEAAYRKLGLPIACLVYSGGKSLHAIVKIDAADYEEYRWRVDFLYSRLSAAGIEIDRQNRNPSRLSRMPGVMRGGERQRLLAVDIGRKDWADWVQFIEEEQIPPEFACLPAPRTMTERIREDPDPPPELIKGILRQGHKMLISGASKAGKSFLLMELCIALAEGREWLGFQCRKSRVMYVNLEIDPDSSYGRFKAIYRALGIEHGNTDDLSVWDLRGKAMPLNRLVPGLVWWLRRGRFDAVVVDPIYKVITGDENSASDMGAFCNQFDRICDESGCSVIYCHHHSKGYQGSKRSMDRASGSGVFARDPDAQLDLIQLELTPEQQLRLQDGNATAWRMESSLREFANIKPVDLWFDYPIHRVDRSGMLADSFAEGSPEANLCKSSKRTSEDGRRERLDVAFDALNDGKNRVKVGELAEYMGIVTGTVRRYVKERSKEYWCENGLVGRHE